MTADLIAAARSGFDAALAAAAPARALAPALAALTAPPDAILAIGKAASANGTGLPRSWLAGTGGDHHQS